MAQRGNSKKAKGRKEEEELDRQLSAAGLLDDGMTLPQKRELAQILSFSVSSAQEEESQRRTRELEEEKIIEKTLDKSINVENDLQDDSENSRGSDDVVIISGGPDSDSQASRSSQLSKGIIGLDRSQNAEKSSQHVSQCNSDQDLFCDSQGEKREYIQKHFVNPVGEPSSQIEKSISTSSADSASENAHKSLEKVQKTYTNVTSRRGIRKHPSADEIASPSAKALRRHATVHEVSSPSTKAQQNLAINEKVQSQPLFVSGSSNISVRGDKSLQSAIDSEADTQLFSPLIGARKVINGRAVNTLQNQKSSNVQESQISNSLEVVRLHPEKLNNEDDSSTDDEIFSSPVQSPSILQKASTPAGVLSKSSLSAVSTPNTSNVNLRLSVSPGMSPAMEKSSVKSVNKDGEVNSLSISSASQNPVLKDQIEDDVKKIDDDATQEIVVTPSVSSTDKVLASSIHEENVSTHHSDKDSENSSDANDNCSDSINKKSFLKVFPLSKSDTEPLQRKNMRSEKRNLTYMKHENESENECKRRIISLIDTSSNILENYQGSLGYRMKWAIPVSVDKRVKEWTLIRPQQNIRKILPASEEEIASGIKRATRQTRKVREQNQGEDSDDSLPDIIHNSQDSKLKPSSQRRSIGGKFSNNQDNSRRITNDSEDDLDDFDIFPSKNSKQFGKTTVKMADSTPRRTPKSSQDVDYVSSSRLQEDVKTNSEDKNINFELNVNDSDDDDKKHISGENYINTPKRKPNDSFEQSRPIKRRKTFMLNVEEDEVASSSNISENVQQEEVMQSSLDTEITSVVDEGEERSKYFCDKNLKDEVEGLVSSQEQKKETNFVTSSYEESHDDVIPGPSSSNADLFILENTDAKRRNDKSTSSTTNTKGTSKSQQKVQIRPGRLKFAGRRNNGKRDAPNEEGDQISSSLEQDTADIEEIIKVECPLCAREFPQNKIEVHASTCNGQVDSTVEEVEERSLIQRASGNATVNSSSNPEAAVAKEDTSNRRPIAATAQVKRPRTPPSFVRCYLCDEVFPEGDEYAIHVGNCGGQQKVVEGIKSPSSTASPRTWAKTKSMQRGPKQIQPYGTSSALLKKRSVFEQLEGSGPSRSRTTAPPRQLYEDMKDSVTNNTSEADSDDYDFPDSPIRSFVPISQLTDSDIDYHNQYRDKSRKVAAGTSKAGSKTKRKKKSTRGRGKTRKRGK